MMMMMMMKIYKTNTWLNASMTTIYNKHIKNNNNNRKNKNNNNNNNKEL